MKNIKIYLFFFYESNPIIIFIVKYRSLRVYSFVRDRSNLSSNDDNKNMIMINKNVNMC